jgi:gliding motility-associated-like protein
LFAPGDTFVLIPFLTGAHGLAFSTWISDNATLHRPTLPIYEANTWIWIVKDSIGCEIRDTFDAALRELIVIDADSISPSCEGMTDGSIIINDIDGGIGPYTVQVDGNQPFVSSTFPDTITGIGVGAHMISATNLDGCETILPMNIESNSSGGIDLGPDVTIPIGDSLLIDPILVGINASTVEWVPAIHPPILESFWYLPTETTLLSITVTDSAGCIYTDEKLITVTIERHFYIPTIFSPNGDQINDVLHVETSSNPIDIRSLEIFDRWGNMLYRQLESPPFSWDGKYRNEDVPAGVYVIKLIWKDDLGNDQFYISDLTLIR